MKLRPIHRSSLLEMTWIGDVRESRHPLTEQQPIWVRHGIVRSGPTIPHPERHPYCEFSTIQEGAAIALVGRENVERLAGDYFLAGPGVAHWYKGTRYPVRFAAVYFLPSILIEMGPTSDGMQILQRFTARQTLADRLVRPAVPLAPILKSGFDQIVQEFDGKAFGREVRLRTLLMEMLVQMLRWERQRGREFKVAMPTTGWTHVEKALSFLRQNYSNEIYARDLAAVAGVSQSRMKSLFHDLLGMPWSRYLQGYRIHRAAALLSQPGHSILEASMAVGFESLSHFNTTFRSVMGVSPRNYSRKAAGKDDDSKARSQNSPNSG
jgi:AraC-like DNA-binding protein